MDADEEKKNMYKREQSFAEGERRSKFLSLLTSPEAVNPSILRMFQAALKTTELAKTLGHIKHINAGV